MRRVTDPYDFRNGKNPPSRCGSESEANAADRPGRPLFSFLGRDAD